jgi:GNAT superfamily N-acetyltransferase
MKKRRASSANIAIAQTTEQIRRCHPVMRQLRSHFARPAEFVRQVRRQQEQGYFLAFLESRGKVQAVAGYRYLESLFSDKNLYVDDLVTDETVRSSGFGGQLIDWLTREAARHGCGRLELDSGVQRDRAHRFYFAKGLKIDSFHFRKEIVTASRKRTHSTKNKR